MVAAWWKERLRYVGPYGELTTVVFVHISDDTGLHKVHPTWALGWAAWLLSGWAGWWSFIYPPTMVTIPPSIVINLPSIWPT